MTENSSKLLLALVVGKQHSRTHFSVRDASASGLGRDCLRVSSARSAESDCVFISDVQFLLYN